MFYSRVFVIVVWQNGQVSAHDTTNPKIIKLMNSWIGTLELTALLS